MPDKGSEKIWHNGKLIAWEDAKIHIMSHTINYASSLFEGIRCYNTLNGSAVFRLDKHIQRLVKSCKIYRIDIPYTSDALHEAVLETIRANKMKQCYIRPIVLRGLGEFGVNPFSSPVEVFVAAWDWGKYLGPEALDNGVDVCVSSWTRMAPNTLPAMAKAAANYMNSQLVKMEAIKNGYVEGIALDPFGFVSEGSGENIFLVLDRKVYTPPLTASILSGVTRDSVITICRDLGYEVLEQSIPREMLYISDELFFTGTAAEITPIRSVDKIKIGSGVRGSVTKEIQDVFFSLIKGERLDRHSWLTPVYKAEGASQGKYARKAGSASIHI